MCIAIIFHKLSDMSKKMTWSLVTVIAAGIAVYVLVQRKKKAEKKYSEKRDQYLSDVYLESKKHGGAEFVL
jgi:hypothetical protein